MPHELTGTFTISKINRFVTPNGRLSRLTAYTTDEKDDRVYFDIDLNDPPMKIQIGDGISLRGKFVNCNYNGPRYSRKTTRIYPLEYDILPDLII
jgi:hypothetical protein